MTSYGTRRAPQVPTLPTGEEVASYATYLEAQQAVDFLSDREFAVQNVTIVGSDLRMVERITGRLTYPRVAGAGALSGAWFGIFVGLLLGLVMGQNLLLVLLPAMAIGAAFGMLFGVVSYSFTGGKRDFTSSSQVVANRYSLLCLPERAGEARALLAEAPVRSQRGGPTVVSRPPEAPTPPSYGENPVPGAPPSTPAPPTQAPAAPPAPAPEQQQPDQPGQQPRYGANPPRYGANPPES
ncbi:conserved hypothetical protein [Beutenbergia cavernae DSM 12333]|uniref:General stress protein 17M-like domain-containing protein n=1 Tax=Beutenbergia cavernae (strain ATCC BAA-8 / DSM 12333 / CCUG 43141 / JCM 11478 / NBRC 16432 / NCIMB 13614 / HKI 0122) TaxID=471853 RepID=C5BZ42_BEUC1|nr:general stress protein [Beutenbergia cavernae]ACQ81157.1 conserved hypothetical protein [Beutenbergia cavernae DSM 12333]